MICAFADAWEEFGWPPCGNGIHHHHAINKSKLAGNKRAKKLVETLYQDIFIVPVCGVHNVGRYADTKYARKYLLELWPRHYVEEALAHVRSCYKGDYPELSYEALT